MFICPRCVSVQAHKQSCDDVSKKTTSTCILQLMTVTSQQKHYIIHLCHHKISASLTPWTTDKTLSCLSQFFFLQFTRLQGTTGTLPTTHFSHCDLVLPSMLLLESASLPSDGKEAECVCWCYNKLNAPRVKPQDKNAQAYQRLCVCACLRLLCVCVVSSFNI